MRRHRHRHYRQDQRQQPRHVTWHCHFQSRPLTPGIVKVRQDTSTYVKVRWGTARNRISMSLAVQSWNDRRQKETTAKVAPPPPRESNSWEIELCLRPTLRKVRHQTWRCSVCVLKTCVFTPDGKLPECPLFSSPLNMLLMWYFASNKNSTFGKIRSECWLQCYLLIHSSNVQKGTLFMCWSTKNKISNNVPFLQYKICFTMVTNSWIYPQNKEASCKRHTCRVTPLSSRHQVKSISERRLFPPVHLGILICIQSTEIKYGCTVHLKPQK